MVKYYGDRANKGGMQLTEATDICHNASAYPGVPGVFTDAQLAGWRKVTDAVHAKGGFIYAPLLITALLHILYPIVLNPALLRFSF